MTLDTHKAAAATRAMQQKQQLQQQHEQGNSNRSCSSRPTMQAPHVKAKGLCR
jgi:hypothetical protein